MLHATRIVPEHRADEKLLAALLMLFTLKGVYLALVVGASAAALLFVLTIILDAVLELCNHVGQVWLASTPLEKLLIFVIGWLFFWKLSPFIARVSRHCWRVF